MFGLIRGIIGEKAAFVLTVFWYVALIGLIIYLSAYESGTFRYMNW